MQVTMKLYSSYKVHYLKSTFPKFETFNDKIDDFRSFQSYAIFPSKMVFELREKTADVTLVT